jgi:hypothetical protein
MRRADMQRPEHETPETVCRDALVQASGGVEFRLIILILLVGEVCEFYLLTY